MGLEWCMGMPPPCSFPKLSFSSRSRLSTSASLPCRASFSAAGEFGCAWVVLAVHAPAA